MSNLEAPSSLAPPLFSPIHESPDNIMPIDEWTLKLFMLRIFAATIQGLQNYFVTNPQGFQPFKYFTTFNAKIEDSDWGPSYLTSGFEANQTTPSDASDDSWRISKNNRCFFVTKRHKWQGYFFTKSYREADTQFVTWTRDGYNPQMFEIKLTRCGFIDLPRLVIEIKTMSATQTMIQILTNHPNNLPFQYVNQVIEKDSEWSILQTNVLIERERDMRKQVLLKYGKDRRKPANLADEQKQERILIEQKRLKQMNYKFDQTQALAGILKYGSHEDVMHALEGQSMVKYGMAESIKRSNAGKSITIQNPGYSLKMADETNVVCADALRATEKGRLLDIAKSLGIKVVSRDLKPVLCEKIMRHLHIQDNNVPSSIDYENQIEPLG